MRNNYKINCQRWDDVHVEFQLFDPSGANCGKITVLADDVFNFIRYSWKGDIFWNGLMPEKFVMGTFDDRPETPRTMHP